MSLFFPSDQPKQQRKKTKHPPDIESMLSGLLMGLASIGFAACTLLVLNGRAEKWIRQWRESHQTRQAAPVVRGK